MIRYLASWTLVACGVLAISGCSGPRTPEPPVDLLLVNARVYTLAWPEPRVDGTPDTAAPFSKAAGWRPDA